jgi:acyl-CoA thioester hydrolase
MFRFQMRVPYSDITLGNHVYYARYLNWLEAARGEAFREMGKTLLEYQDENLMFPVVECLVKFHKAARYDDEIEVRSGLAEVAKVRFLWVYEVVRGEDILADARTLHVCATLGEKPTRLPDDLANKMRDHVRK